MDTNIKNFLPGSYKVISSLLNIRKEPRVTWTNIKGQLKMGDVRDVYEFITTPATNDVWGRISEYDGAGKALWICAKNVNREFIELVPKTDPIVTIPPTKTNDQIELIVNGVIVYKNF